MLVILGLTHVTIASVTIFLHRHEAHHALDLHPLASHFFRAWLWLTTGNVTRNWVAIHRKHHAKCETPEDPRSPKIFGLNKVLFDGVDLYRREAAVAETLERYGHGAPNDALERHLYARHSRLGIALMLMIDLVLFGPIGLTVWAVQMLWVPFFAAGVINGIGHYWGYRRFAPNDSSRNIVPWGILVGGEELHNNHHAYATSAKLSNEWWEIDIGWLYIRLLEALGLAKVRRVAPKMRFDPTKRHCDDDTLQAIVTHRYAVLARFVRSLKPTAREEVRQRHVGATLGLRENTVLRAVQNGLQRGAENLPGTERVILEQALAASPLLRTLYAMRQELVAVWCRSSVSRERLVKQLEIWLQQAETSGVIALQQFSKRLCGLRLTLQSAGVSLKPLARGTVVGRGPTREHPSDGRQRPLDLAVIGKGQQRLLQHGVDRAGGGELPPALRCQGSTVVIDPS